MSGRVNPQPVLRIRVGALELSDFGDHLEAATAVTTSRILGAGRDRGALGPGRKIARA